jgi:membrane protein implicated in regulation of membrane protease activity
VIGSISIRIHQINSDTFNEYPNNCLFSLFWYLLNTSLCLFGVFWYLLNVSLFIWCILILIERITVYLMYSDTYWTYQFIWCILILIAVIGSISIRIHQINSDTFNEYQNTSNKHSDTFNKYQNISNKQWYVQYSDTYWTYHCLFGVFWFLLNVSLFIWGILILIKRITIVSKYTK